MRRRRIDFLGYCYWLETEAPAPKNQGDPKDASAGILFVVDIRSGLAIGSLDRVLQIAIGLLYLAFAFVHNAFIVKVGVTDNIGDRLFGLAFQFIHLPCNLFFFHARSLRK